VLAESSIKDYQGLDQWDAREGMVLQGARCALPSLEVMQCWLQHTHLCICITGCSRHTHHHKKKRGSDIYSRAHQHLNRILYSHALKQSPAHCNIKAKVTYILLMVQRSHHLVSHNVIPACCVYAVLMQTMLSSSSMINSRAVGASTSMQWHAVPA
jgi:hypothetical protein